MTEKLYIDNVEYWQDVIVAHLLHGECSDVAPQFTVDFSVNRPSDIQFARIRSVGHRFEEPKGTSETPSKQTSRSFSSCGEPRYKSTMAVNSSCNPEI